MVHYLGAGQLTIESDESWQGEVSFTPDMPADEQKVEFLLYKNGGTEPCMEPLYLWIDVNG